MRADTETVLGPYPHKNLALFRSTIWCLWQAEVQVRRVTADEKPRDDSVTAQKGMHALGEMNTNLE